MIDVVVERTIARPRGEVAAFASDWRNDTRWIGGVGEPRLVGDGQFGVGARVLRIASFLGRRIEYVNEVVAFEPESRLAMRSVRGPFPMSVTYEFEDVGDGATLMRIRASGDAGGFYRLAAPLLARAVRRSIAGDLSRLDELLAALPR